MRTAKQKSFEPQRFTDRLVGSFPVLEALEARQLLSVTISAPMLFTTLDNGPLDSNPAVGTVLINDDLIMTGTGSITANDPASPANNSASPIILDVTGNMTMGTGTSIFAENRVGAGNGGNIKIDLSQGGALTMADKAIISSSRTVGGGTGNGGNIEIFTNAGFTMLKGSIIAANCAGSGRAGDITIVDASATPVTDVNPAKTIYIDGLVASGPSTALLSGRLLETSLILAGGNTTQRGGNITIRNEADTKNADVDLARIVVDTNGVIVSQGQDPASGKITLQSQCAGITINGLVGSVAPKGHGTTTNSPQVLLLSPRFIRINGAELDGKDVNGDGLLTQRGRVRADYTVGEGSQPFGVEMYARSDITVTGPKTGTIPAVSAFGGSANNPALFGGTIKAFAVGDPTQGREILGTIAATGYAFDASCLGGKGGTIDLRAKNDVRLDDATIKANGKVKGGEIDVRSYAGDIWWTKGFGYATPAATGKIVLTAPTVGDIHLGATLVPPPTLIGIPFDPTPTGELAVLDGQLVALKPLGLPVPCVRGWDCQPLDTTIVLDVDTTVNFNTALFDPAGNLIPGTVTYIGDLDLLPFFTPFAKKSLLVDQWEARFNIGLHRLDILDGVLLTVTSIGIGNNQPAPGIEIEGGEIFLQGDLDKNGDGGGSIIVTSINKQAGHIFIDMVHDILVDGSIIDQVIGTNGAPGDIILKTFCGDIRVGKTGRVETRGVDHGGADIIMVDGVPDSLFAGNIVIEGLVRATYKGGTVSTDPKIDTIPEIDIVNFKNSGQIIIDGTSANGATPVIFGKDGDGTPVVAGVHIKCLRDPIPGTINLQAVSDITVLGNDGSLPGSYGTVSVKTSSSNVVGGTINVRSLSGSITAQDRAFDVTGRYNRQVLPKTYATITLKANGPINLTATKPLAVVDSSGSGSGSTGGTNRIRSYSSGVTVGPNAKVLATGVATAGKNHLVGTPVTILGTVNPANSVAPAVDPINDPLLPLFPTLASLGHGIV